MIFRIADNNRQSGSSLLEVLISVCVLALGILSFAKLQLQAVADSVEAQHRSLANNQLQAMVEILRSHLTVAERGRMISAWQHENARVLPSGRGTVEKMGCDFQVRIDWEGSVAHKPVGACQPIYNPVGRCVALLVVL
jgi:Tfp pilus assembly protein PilV